MMRWECTASTSRGGILYTSRGESDHRTDAIRSAFLSWVDHDLPGWPYRLEILDRHIGIISEIVAPVVPKAARARRKARSAERSPELPFDLPIEDRSR